METKFAVPEVRFNARFSEEENPFAKTFGSLDHDSWRQLIINSITNKTVDNIDFPAYPDAETQNRIHGHANESAMNESFGFFDFVRKSIPAIENFNGNFNFLDFAAGWGRISRPYMRSFDLRKMYCYEPNLSFASLARSLNPYVNTLTGPYLPDGTLPMGHFNLIVGWSIFSHLSELAVRIWLAEFARILVPGGHVVMTTWGKRFLDRLIREKEEMEAGRDIHWYSRVCIQAAGDIKDLSARHANGEMIWFTGGGSKLYGEAFLPSVKIDKILREQSIPLVVERYDSTSLSQDVFILRKRQ